MNKTNKTDLKIGVLGGGQLGKMLLEAASPLSLNVSILDKDRNFPSGPHTNQFEIGDFKKYEDVLKFGSDKDLITIEIESVNLQALYELEKLGKKVFPQPNVLEIIKDKGTQKLFYQEKGIPTSAFHLYDDKEAILKAILNEEIALPFVQKSRTDGYDGKGVQVVRKIKDLDALFDTPSLIEELVDIDKEIAVIVARNESGEIKSFPLVEMQFHPTANLVEFLFSPSRIEEHFQNEAKKLAEELANKFNVIGLLAIEMFLTKDGRILVNEVAPRPHNSGHHTIEGCMTSQFSQMWRALLDLPLGDTSLRSPSVMLNLLGEKDYTGEPYYKGLETLLSTSGVFPHIYGKPITKPYRKMGHITIINQELEEAIRIAKKVKDDIKVISQ